MVLIYATFFLTWFQIIPRTAVSPSVRFLGADTTVHDSIYDVMVAPNLYGDILS